MIFYMPVVLFLSRGTLIQTENKIKVTDDDDC